MAEFWKKVLRHYMHHWKSSRTIIMWKMSIAHPMLNSYSVMYWTLSQSHYVYVATNKSRSKKGLHNSFNFLEIWYNFLGCLHRFINVFTFSWHRQMTWLTSESILILNIQSWVAMFHPPFWMINTLKLLTAYKSISIVNHSYF